MIVKKGGKWCLMHKDGSGPPLGCHDSKAGAERQETAINIAKAKREEAPMTRLKQCTEQIRALLEEDAVRAEFLEACYESGLTPPDDLSVEAMLEFALTEEGKIKKGFKMVFGKLKKLGKTIGLAAAIGSAAVGGHHNITHARPERDAQGVSFRTGAQQSRVPTTHHQTTTQSGGRR